MAVYRFKIVFEDDEDVFRVIEIRSTQTFKDFHDSIQKAIGFDNSKSASFFMSDDYWRKGLEIALTDSADKGVKPKRLMEKSTIAGFIEDPHQKMLYLFDYDAHWNFTVELVKIILSEEPAVSYPRCVNSVGIAPKQYKPTNINPIVDDEDEHEPTSDKIFQHEEGFDEGEEDEEGKLIDEEDSRTESEEHEADSGEVEEEY